MGIAQTNFFSNLNFFYIFIILTIVTEEYTIYLQRTVADVFKSFVIGYCAAVFIKDGYYDFPFEIITI